MPANKKQKKKSNLRGNESAEASYLTAYSLAEVPTNDGSYGVGSEAEKKIVILKTNSRSSLQTGTRGYMGTAVK